MKDRVFFATAPSRNWSWSNDSDFPSRYGGTASSNTANRSVSWGAVDGRLGALAVTYTQASNGYITFSRVVLDNAGEPFSCSADDAPNGTWDLWSVITHEVGHTIKLFDLSSGGVPNSRYDGRCVNNIDQPTMCSPIYSGTERVRVLEPEDINSANSAY